MFFEVGDVAGFVDDDGGAAADVGFGEEEVVLLDDFALDVGEEVVGDVELFAEGFVAPDGVDGDAEDDGVFGIEVGEVGHEAGVLVGADGGEVEGVEGEDDVLFAAEVGEFDFGFVLVFEFEIGGGLAGGDGHGGSCGRDDGNW